MINRVAVVAACADYLIGIKSMKIIEYEHGISRVVIHQRVQDAGFLLRRHAYKKYAYKKLITSRSKAMKHQDVESGNMESAGYSPESKTLEIRFKGGGLYSYAGVPQSAYDGLMSAESKGKYFYANIKNSYKWKKVE